MTKKLILKMISEKKCDFSKIARVLKFQPKHANNFDDHGSSLLHRAVEKQEIKLVELLLNCGADPNVRNKMGYTPLHLAVLYNNYNIVEILINNNANVNSRSNSGKTPLHLLSMRKENEASYKIGEILLKNYASTSLRDACGFTPLDYLNSTKKARI